MGYIWKNFCADIGGNQSRDTGRQAKNAEMPIEDLTAPAQKLIAREENFQIQKDLKMQFLLPHLNCLNSESFCLFIGTFATLRIGSPYVYFVQIYEFCNKRLKLL